MKSPSLKEIRAAIDYAAEMDRKTLPIMRDIQANAEAAERAFAEGYESLVATHGDLSLNPYPMCRCTVDSEQE